MEKCTLGKAVVQRPRKERKRSYVLEAERNEVWLAQRVGEEGWEVKALDLKGSTEAHHLMSHIKKC